MKIMAILCELCKFSVFFLKKKQILTDFCIKIKLKWFLLRKKNCWFVFTFSCLLGSQFRLPGPLLLFFALIEFYSITGFFFCFQIMKIIRSFFQRICHLVVQCLFFFWLFSSLLSCLFCRIWLWSSFNLMILSLEDMCHLTAWWSFHIIQK